MNDEKEASFLKQEIAELESKLAEKRKKLQSLQKKPGNFFLRQQVLFPWDGEKQTKVIQKQTALVLGCGGYGTNHIMALCRLGFKKLFICDYDVVEDHNLNRQLLFNKDSIGKRKVDECKKNADRFHNYLPTEIVKMHGDVVKGWDKIVKVAKECTCILTSIDISDDLTFAIYSLGAALGIPVVYGGTEPTVGHYLELYLQAGDVNSPFCDSWDFFPQDKKNYDALMPSKVMTYKDLSPYIKMSPMAKGGSTIYSCSMGALTMVSLLVTHLLGIDTVPNMVQINLYTWTFDSFKFSLDKDPSRFPEDLKKLDKK